MFLPEHIGDIVAAEPIARHLKEKNPTTDVAWFVYEAHKEILQANKNVDLVLPIRCSGEYNVLASEELFDSIHFCRIEPPKECIYCSQPWRWPSQARPLTSSNYYTNRTLLQAFCENAGLPNLNIAPRLHLPASAQSFVESLNLPSDFVCIHAVSNDERRNWTQEKWQELSRWIACDLGMPVVEIGMQAALKSSERIRTDLCGKLTLTQSATVVSQASLFIGIDSGPAHFANAAGISRVVLLGNFAAFPKYLPYSGDTTWLSNLEVIHWTAPSANIPVSEVVRRITALKQRGLPRCKG